MCCMLKILNEIIVIQRINLLLLLIPEMGIKLEFACLLSIKTKKKNLLTIKNMCQFKYEYKFYNFLNHIAIGTRFNCY